VADSTLRAAFFPGFDFSSATLGNATERNLIINPLIAKTISTGLSTQPASANVSTELNSLIDGLCTGGACAVSRTPIVVKAACTAVLASAVTTVQ
jgi:hypothetical protein